jgi:hypothetical protein
VIAVPEATVMSVTPFLVGGSIGALILTFFAITIGCDEFKSWPGRIAVCMAGVLLGAGLGAGGGWVVASLMRTSATSAHDREVFEDHFGVTLVERQADQDCTVTFFRACDPTVVPRLPRDLGKRVEATVWRDGQVHACTVLVVAGGWVVTCVAEDGETFELTPHAGSGAEVLR